MLFDCVWKCICQNDVIKNYAHVSVDPAFNLYFNL